MEQERNLWAPPAMVRGQWTPAPACDEWPALRPRRTRFWESLGIGLGVVVGAACLAVVATLVYVLGSLDGACDEVEDMAHVRTYQAHRFLNEPPPSAVLAERSHYCQDGLSRPFTRFTSAAPGDAVREHYKSLALDDGWTLVYDKGAAKPGADQPFCGHGTPESSRCTSEVSFIKIIENGEVELWLTVDSYVDADGEAGLVVAIL